MLNVKLDEVEGIVILEPNGELSKNDFTSAAEIIDPYIEKNGELKGIIIHVKSFPRWDSFSSLVAHLKFVKDHHKKVSRIAFATDSSLGTVAENIASHFVNAELKSFGFSELDSCKNWILNSDI